MAAGDWRERLRAAGRTDTDLARKLNKSKSAVSRIMSGERKDLRRSEVEAIEAALDEFEGRQLRPTGAIPLLGLPAPQGGDRILWDVNSPLAWVEAPPAAQGVETAAVRVPGDTMFPRLYPGETVYVALGMNPGLKGDVLVEFTDGTAVLRTYEGRRQGHVFLHRYNPDEQETVEETRVRNLHAVTWRR